MTCIQVLTTHLSTRVENAEKMFNNLKKEVKTKDELRTIFFSYPVDKIMEKLRENETGSHFLGELKAFLSGFGYYKEKILDPAIPSYIESPSRILETIISEITSGDEEINIIDETYEKKLCMDTIIDNNKFPVTFIFKILLKILQKLTKIEEEEVFYFTIYTPLLRRTLLELGAKLSLKENIDIFFLLNNEIQETLTNPSFPLTSLSSRIEQRKAEIKKNIQIVEEPIPTEDVDTESGFVLTGIPVSKGKCQGRVKVIRDMSLFPEVKDNDIIIAPYIDPSWHFLIKKAGAVVTEFGGMLSLGSVLAREYKKPAVAGVQNVLMSFIDHQSVEVNGNTGKIRRL